MVNFVAAQVILARAAMPDVQHALVFIPHWGLRVKAVGAGIKVGVAAFNVDHKANVAEEACFGSRIKAEEGDAAFVDSASVFQVGPGDVGLHF